MGRYLRSSYGIPADTSVSALFSSPQDCREAVQLTEGPASTHQTGGPGMDIPCNYTEEPVQNHPGHMELTIS